MNKKKKTEMLTITEWTLLHWCDEVVRTWDEHAASAAFVIANRAHDKDVISAVVFFTNRTQDDYIIPAAVFFNSKTQDDDSVSL